MRLINFLLPVALFSLANAKKGKQCAQGCQDQHACLEITSMQLIDEGYEICIDWNSDHPKCKKDGLDTFESICNDHGKGKNKGKKDKCGEKEDICEIVECGEYAKFAVRDGGECEAGSGGEFTISGVDDVVCQVGDVDGMCDGRCFHDCVWKVRAPECTTTDKPTTSWPTKKPTTTTTTAKPTKDPTPWPTPYPTDIPTKFPTDLPTKPPTNIPTRNPTDNPSRSPTEIPTNSPTAIPTINPTTVPTKSPTDIPTKSPTNYPTLPPTDEPTKSPTNIPTVPPTDEPTKSPTEIPTTNPTDIPTRSPTKSPTNIPTTSPTTNPTTIPTVNPTSDPTPVPTAIPTPVPTKSPTDIPTKSPTNIPTTSPTTNPTDIPSYHPTSNPTVEPTFFPTSNPTKNPSTQPTTSPITAPCEEYKTGDRLADYALINDMSRYQGVNDRCDVYSTGPVDVLSTNRLIESKLAIGDEMEMHFRMNIVEKCVSSLGCTILRIGDENSGYYPALLLGSDTDNDGSHDLVIQTMQFDANGIEQLIEYRVPNAVHSSTADYHSYAMTWTQTGIALKIDGNSVFSAECNQHRVVTTDYIGEEKPDFTKRVYTAPATQTLAKAAVVLSEICIKSDWYPEWDKLQPTTCYTKQNLVAEVMTALKSFDSQEGGADTGGQENDLTHEGLQKNVRFAYIKVDGDGATVDVALDDDFNFYPVTKEDLVDEFIRIEHEECGAGTDDVVDLCAGVDAAIAQFDEHRIVPTESTERERKMAIISNNRQKDDLLCLDGQHICAKYEALTLGEEGVSIVLINIDMAGNANEYLPCLTYYEGKNDNSENHRILDVSTQQLNDNDFRDGPTFMARIKENLCDYIPTPTPTKSPTNIPTNFPTNMPTKSPTDVPTKSPTENPTLPPTPSPTDKPTPGPTCVPTKSPTDIPTKSPTIVPTQPPSKWPTPLPTGWPTKSPTPNPTKSPTDIPTTTTAKPTPTPTCPDRPPVSYGYGHGGNACNGFTKECCSSYQCQWNTGYACQNGDDPTCCEEIPEPTVSPTEFPTTDPSPTPTKGGYGYGYGNQPTLKPTKKKKPTKGYGYGNQPTTKQPTTSTYGYGGKNTNEPTTDPTDMPSQDHGYGYGNEPPSTTSSYGYINENTNAPTTDPTDMPTEGYGYKGYTGYSAANSVVNHEVSLEDATKVLENEFKSHWWLIIGGLIVVISLTALCCWCICSRHSKSKKRGSYGFVSDEDEDGNDPLDESDVAEVESDEEELVPDLVK